MLPLYVIEDNMPSLSNSLSTGKVKRRARKVIKHYPIHSSATDWTDTAIGTLVSDGNLVSTAPGGRGGTTYTDITVVSGVRYRYSVMVVGSTGSGTKKIKLGTPLDTDAYKTNVITSLDNAVAGGTFTPSATTTRLTFEIQSASATLTIGKIIIEEA